MEHSLLSPNQARAFSHQLCLNPKQYTGGQSLHGIKSESDDIMIPFQMHGCISYIPIYRPTPEELRNCPYVYRTAEEQWEPYADTFAQAEKVFDCHWAVYATSSHDH
jgi:hypothetical protein